MDTGIVVGPGGLVIHQLADSPAVRLDLFVDYLCPFCKRFSDRNLATLQQLVDQEHAQLVIHPVAFLDRFSKGTEYSTRTAGAAYAAATLAPDRYLAFNQTLFANQPREGTTCLDDAELAALATDAGLPDQTVKQLTDHKYLELALQATRDAIDLGVQGTPCLVATRSELIQELWDGETPIPAMVRRIAELPDSSVNSTAK
ncbi:MAG: DsbA family protein [Bifidobacteriaceae bacterium]|jgi:protein-disulfide isomerase|nr:DsbA family protein [Bifidobacteriaceae bacterium]